MSRRLWSQTDYDGMPPCVKRRLAAEQIRQEDAGWLRSDIYAQGCERVGTVIEATPHAKRLRAAIHLAAAYYTRWQTEKQGEAALLEEYRRSKALEIEVFDLKQQLAYERNRNAVLANLVPHGHRTTAR